MMDELFQRGTRVVVTRNFPANRDPEIPLRQV
jgi:hypothetical protein